MSNKKFEVVVKTGSWTDREGKAKNKYLNVGTVFENDDKKMFMVLNRTFSPAGVPNPENKEAVILSFFEPKPKETSGSTTETPKSDEVSWQD